MKIRTEHNITETPSRHAVHPFHLLISVFVITGMQITCFAQETPKPDPAVSWENPVVVDRGNGIRGPWRMNRSNFQYVDDPKASVAADGQIAMTWVDQSRQQILFQRFDPTHNPQLNEPAAVSDSPNTFSWFPDVLMTNDDPAHVYVLWQEIVFSGGSHGGETFFSRSTDGGNTFEAPINLSKSKAGDGKGRLTKRVWHNGSLDLAIGPNGTLFAAWTSYEGRLWFRYSTDAGRTFSDPVLVYGTRKQPPARGPSLAVSTKNRIHLTWTVGEREAANLRFTTLHPFDDRTSNPRLVHRTDGLSDAPKLAVDDQGTIHLAYGERPVHSSKPDHVRYTRSTDGGNHFSKPVHLSAPDKFPHHRAGYPDLEVTGDRSVVVTWEGFDRDRHASQPDRLLYAISTNGGGSFSTPAHVPRTDAPENGFNGSQQGLLMGKLDMNRNRELVVVNSQFIPNRRSAVYFISGSIDN